eukprot:jgi/Botrbrau1/7212/Bobra.0300s0037.1
MISDYQRLSTLTIIFVRVRILLGRIVNDLIQESVESIKPTKACIVAFERKIQTYNQQCYRNTFVTIQQYRVASWFQALVVTLIEICIQQEKAFRMEASSGQLWAVP